jgi:hypothetical protein
VFLMASAALLAKLSMAIGPAFHILNMGTTVVALPRKITGRMTVETARMFQYRND